MKSKIQDKKDEVLISVKKNREKKKNLDTIKTTSQLEKNGQLFD